MSSIFDYLGQAAGQLADGVGTALNLPGIGLSEALNGGSTQNTGRINENANPLYSSYVTQTKSPAAPGSPVQAGGSGSGLDLSGLGAGGTSGGSVAASTYDPATIQYYDDQINQGNQALSRIGDQLNVGNSNIDNSFQSALNKLLQQNATAEQDAALTKQRAIDDNVTARDTVDQNVGRQSNALQRLLGQSSSAASVLAPYAVAKQGTTQLNGIQDAYGRNLQDLDIADQKRQQQFDTGQSDLQTQRDQQKNALQASLNQNQASILQQLSDLATQKASAKGQSYAQARAATQDYSSRINDLLNSVTQLGSQYANPVLKTTDLGYVAPDLASYDTNSAAISAPTSALQQQVSPFYSLLAAADDKKKNAIA